MTADDAFEVERPRLKRLAYRMLGSVHEADDVVQDAWLRWRRAEGVVEAAAWLTRVATRLCLDRLRADRAERAAYRGPWLPEPLIEDIADDPVERAEEISVAFLLALERLSPLERAVFLLRDVFDADYSAIAETLERTEPACRQLAARARAHLKDARPRFPVAEDEAARLALAFMDAARRNDMTALKAVLAEDALMITDGGGKRKAALRPLVGRDDIAALVAGLIWRGAIPIEGRVRFARINGAFGVVLSGADELVTLAFEPGEGGQLAAIYMVRNPEKLTHVAR
ncbi:MAG TPA: RNA polymerase sigma factor SigJ [Caulobacteraceae bacterium]|nr:RNA polymerase sigma factor SigJ [Caulobacteraceae bacterium]